MGLRGKNPQPFAHMWSSGGTLFPAGRSLFLLIKDFSKRPRASDRISRSSPFKGLRVTGANPAVAENMQARRFWISGSVQGVGFRFFAVRAAQRYGLAGYTRNLRDGRVEVYAIGEPDQLAGLRHELEQGPRGARVSGVEEKEAELLPRYADGFSIEYEP